MSQALASYLHTGLEQQAIEAWLARLCDALYAYELATEVDLTKYIVRLGWLSDYELYNPVLMWALFRDIEAAL